ncbi:hypothetical protein CUMW_170830 [Citrus unshiu]|uniref:Uncharacterized protein n=1 Tax=Citrus unshiu TaxID=55188 RepID=A0A2H5PVC1_CITUN|nr:hypothetical protein CUMW_170830 [Citrus unshiu]
MLSFHHPFVIVSHRSFIISPSPQAVQTPCKNAERIKPVEKLIKESDNDVEIAEKIRDLGLAKQMQWNNNNNNNENQGSKAWEECGLETQEYNADSDLAL